jgi:thiamine-phosphate pyrophosphorylase
MMRIPFPRGIYPVTCEALSEGRTDLEVLEGLIAGGAKVVQLRDKRATKRALYEKALEFRRRTTQAGLLLIINDHLDIALAVHADGVHLGRDDLPVAVAKSLAPALIIGASSHSLQEALEAESDGADYVNIGPIFPTKTKEGVGRFLGPEAIDAIAPHLTIPFTVMGGITRETMPLVLAKGASRVAMVSEITRAPDIAGRVASLCDLIKTMINNKYGI